MALFAYRAKDLQGVEHKGTIQTTDTRQVASILSKKGLIVISVKEASEHKIGFLDKFLNRVSFNDVVNMTRQLATMIESGLVLAESLDILVEQQTNKTFKKALEEISQDVKAGIDLSTAFKKHPNIFPPIYSSLISAGEKSGKLDVILVQMATNLERDREFRSRIRGAMIYPIVVICMMVMVAAVMMFFVIPRLTSLYTSSNIDLPLPTKILIGTSGFATRFWWLILAGLVGLIVVFRRWVATSSGAYAFDAILLKIPVVSKIISGTNTTNFTRTFGLLTTAGLPILTSLTIVSEVLGNLVYRKSLQESLRGVERGLPLSAELEQLKIFPRIVPQMIRVGEETGKVDQVSFKLAEYFETETDHFVKNLTVLIEPLVLVVLGAGVAMLVLSIILPIYKLTSSIGNS